MSVSQWPNIILFRLLTLGIFTLSGAAAELKEAQSKFLSGDYAEAIRLAQKESNDGEEDWPLLWCEALWVTGQYDQAQNVVSNALKRFSSSIRLRLAGHKIYRESGNEEKSRQLLEEINELGGSRRWAYRDTANLVALGKAALRLGADPRLVLDNFFEPALKADSGNRDIHLARGEIALDKEDFQLAAKFYSAGLEKFPKDPEMLYGLARAFGDDDRPQMVAKLREALKINERHIPSLLLLADHLIDGEEYEEADEVLAEVFKINPKNADALAYRAVLCHLRNQPDAEKAARLEALKPWPRNPRVDHLIGQKLSAKYRFAEGAKHQRRALELDKDYLRARIHLAEDLLRLGEEKEGWELAEQVHAIDGYDVLAYNLVTLKETLDQFTMVTNEWFSVRMSKHEAAVYGHRVLDLLSRAKKKLCEKYGFELPRPVVIEIFPQQKDFAVRTFGMPGGEGFLGVCFGNVITVNSTAAQSSKPSNWEAVLWHEFCHVITLQLTRNKMPRWLSEGISVYEEKQSDPTWGQRMDPKYREIILSGKYKPIRELSAAFLNPEDSFHLQFAYYESSLVVEFIVGRYGLAALRNVLKDLGEGININTALEARTEAMNSLEKEFKEYAKKLAEALGPGLNWEKPKAGLLSLADDKWEALHPTNFWLMREKAQKLVEDKNWKEAAARLEPLLEMYPEQTGSESLYAPLAAAYRNLGQTNQERRILEQWTRFDGEALDAFARLMELAEKGEQWPVVQKYSQRFLAVNPLVSQPHRFFARASEKLGKETEAIQSYRSVLLLDPVDPSEVHYSLAKLLHRRGDPAAKREILSALENAPRFRDGYDLLLEIENAPRKQTSDAPAKPADPAAVVPLPVPAGSPAIQGTNAPATPSKRFNF